MNDVLARTVLTSTLRAAERLGATVPTATTAEHARLIAAADRLRTLKAEQGHDLGGAVVAALEADRDPYTDPDVLTAVVRRAVAESLHGIEAATAERTAVFVAEHGATILAAFAGPVAAAAATLTDAYRILGDIALADAHAIGKRGGEAGRAWAEAQAAEQVITEVLQVWKQLAQVAPHAVPWLPQYRTLTFADVPADDWIEHRLGGVALSPWDATRHGWTVALATPDEYLERVAAVNAAIAARDDAADDAFQQGYRRMYGTGAA